MSLGAVAALAGGLWGGSATSPNATSAIARTRATNRGTEGLLGGAGGTATSMGVRAQHQAGEMSLHRGCLLTVELATFAP
ncbi:hypothetical protein GCM10009530_75890 [Microbispora corallina]|uniref:Secreted protein n=1 Tax=Microbispora corallina TaxID=83302 RepID=A0ABQ4G004_9ACTN|nr:hypothetical protein Mco01_33960 [Microbispora corallina]